jgi:hypothetical protein
MSSNGFLEDPLHLAINIPAGGLKIMAIPHAAGQH